MGGRTYTQSNEGCNLTAKLDRGGNYVIGWGHNSPTIKAGDVWTQQMADVQFSTDYYNAGQIAAMFVGLSFWANLDPIRQAALTDMAYELGQPRLIDFHQMLTAVRAASWQDAHDQCLDSDYGREVPHRANANASILLTGEWPE